MQTVKTLIARIAPTDSTVVILGETGTGKELAARSIHQQSKRSAKPFVAVNCGALPENLIESELFGHRKGAFTGADSDRTGLFGIADGGTLFLDEIGELPKAVQAKLLRFLENGEVRKIGDNTVMICDVRIVCATLRNLESMVRAGNFREDLWFRINTFEIRIPPLRERKDDLPELLLYFVKKFTVDSTMTALAAKLRSLVTSEAEEALLQYDYPGNVRQLANIAEHALVLTDTLPITLNALPEYITEKLKVNSGAIKDSSVFYPVSAIQSPMIRHAWKRPEIETGIIENCQHLNIHTPLSVLHYSLRDLELQAIESALQRNDGNKAKTAEELGISLKTLYNKLNQTERKSA